MAHLTKVGTLGLPLDAIQYVDACRQCLATLPEHLNTYFSVGNNLLPNACHLGDDGCATCFPIVPNIGKDSSTGAEYTFLGDTLSLYDTGCLPSPVHSWKLSLSTMDNLPLATYI